MFCWKRGLNDTCPITALASCAVRKGNKEENKKATASKHCTPAGAYLPRAFSGKSPRSRGPLPTTAARKEAAGQGWTSALEWKEKPNTSWATSEFWHIFR